MEHKITETIETLVKERQNALRNHNASRAIQIRNDLEEINVKLTDFTYGTKWNLTGKK